MAGLDKKERLKRERGEREGDRDEPARLEPPFPYAMKAFDATFFEVIENTEG